MSLPQDARRDIAAALALVGQGHMVMAILSDSPADSFPDVAVLTAFIGGHHELVREILAEHVGVLGRSLGDLAWHLATSATAEALELLEFALEASYTGGHEGMHCSDDANTLVCVAAEVAGFRGDTELLRWLVARGACPILLERAAHAAASAGNVAFLEVMDRLERCHPEHPPPIADYGHRLLMSAVPSPESVRFLLGPEQLEEDYPCEDVLQAAASAGAHASYEILMSHMGHLFSEPRVREKDVLTAILYGRLDFLTAFGDLLAPTPRMLDKAASAGHLGVVQFLVGRGCRSDNACLCAVRSDKLDVLRFLRDSGMPCNHLVVEVAAGCPYSTCLDYVLEAGLPLPPGFEDVPDRAALRQDLLARCPRLCRWHFHSSPRQHEDPYGTLRRPTVTLLGLSGCQ